MSASDERKVTDSSSIGGNININIELNEKLVLTTKNFNNDNSKNKNTHDREHGDEDDDMIPSLTKSEKDILRKSNTDDLFDCIYQARYSAPLVSFLIGLIAVFFLSNKHLLSSGSGGRGRGDMGTYTKRRDPSEINLVKEGFMSGLTDVANCDCDCDCIG